MRTSLSVGTHLTLSAIGTKQKITVQIQELIGTGASCLVYTAVCREGEQNQFYLRLKEFCPENLHLIRQQDGSLLAAGDAAFQRQMQSFIWGYQKQMHFRQFLESCNSISNVQGVFVGNGTWYIAMNCQNSIPLEQQELSLYDTFRVLRALANQLYGEEHEETGEIWAAYACASIDWYNAQPSRELLEKCKAAMEQALEILLEHDACNEVTLANLLMRYSSVLSELGEFQNCNIIAAEALECFQKNFEELHEQMEWVYLVMADNFRMAWG